jgi:hypothetical protein
MWRAPQSNVSITFSTKLVEHKPTLNQAINGNAGMTSSDSQSRSSDLNSKQTVTSSDSYRFEAKSSDFHTHHESSQLERTGLAYGRAISYVNSTKRFANSKKSGGCSSYDTEKLYFVIFVSVPDALRAWCIERMSKSSSHNSSHVASLA